MASVVVTCMSLPTNLAPATVAVGQSSGSRSASRADGTSKMSVRRLKAFGGLRRESKDVMALSVSQCTEPAFVATMRAQCFSGHVAGARGGAAAARCDVASEIFTVVPIMSGLVLVGVALGFVLLRVEAAIEESE